MDNTISTIREWMLRAPVGIGRSAVIMFDDHGLRITMTETDGNMHSETVGIPWKVNKQNPELLTNILVAAKCHEIDINRNVDTSK